jgi:hypothetical protein
MADEPKLTPKIMAGDETMSPVDLPGSTLIGGRPLLWTTLTVYLAALFLLLTNAEAIHGWAVELEPTPFNARIVEASEEWQAATDRLGLSATRALVHGWWKRAQAARFGHERAE